MNDEIIKRLVKDPVRRGCFLDPETDTVYNMGANFELPGESDKPKPKPKGADLTHSKVILKDGIRGIVTSMGDEAEGDDFFCVVQTENNEEVKIAAKTDMKPLTPAQIKKWDEEIEAAKAA
jgi:DNA topoisomerase VI subunit B